VRGPDLFGHINMLRLCWDCACTSELLYLHRLYTLESPALSFRSARTGKLGGAQRPTPTFLQTAIIYYHSSCVPLHDETKRFHEKYHTDS